MADIYNVVRGDGVFFEGMTKEQIYELIAEMTGQTVQDIDQAFITKLKEINKGNSIRLWVGTTAEYNAIESKEEDVLYICTDDTFVTDTNLSIDNMQTKIEANYENVTAQINDIWAYLNLPVKSYEFETDWYSNNDTNAPIFTLPDDFEIGEATTLYLTVRFDGMFDPSSGGSDRIRISVGGKVNAKTAGTYNIMERTVISYSDYDNYSSYEKLPDLINTPSSGVVSQTLLGFDYENYISLVSDVSANMYIVVRMKVQRTA